MRYRKNDFSFGNEDYCIRKLVVEEPNAVKKSINYETYKNSTVLILIGSSLTLPMTTTSASGAKSVSLN